MMEELPKPLCNSCKTCQRCSAVCICNPTVTVCSDCNYERLWKGIRIGFENRKSLFVERGFFNSVRLRDMKLTGRDIYELDLEEGRIWRVCGWVYIGELESISSKGLSVS